MPNSRPTTERWAAIGPLSAFAIAAAGSGILFLLGTAPFLLGGFPFQTAWLAPLGYQSAWCLIEGWTVACYRPAHLSSRSGVLVARCIAGGAIAITIIGFGEVYGKLAAGGNIGPYNAFAGVALGAAGIALRAASIRALGSRFRDDVSLGCDHPIETTGLYAWLSHPAELGFLLALGGFALACDSVWAALALIFGLIPVCLIRLALERRLLESAATESQGAPSVAPLSAIDCQESSCRSDGISPDGAAAGVG